HRAPYRLRRGRHPDAGAGPERGPAADADRWDRARRRRARDRPARPVPGRRGDVAGRSVLPQGPPLDGGRARSRGRGGGGRAGARRLAVAARGATLTPVAGRRRPPARSLARCARVEFAPGRWRPEEEAAWASWMRSSRYSASAAAGPAAVARIAGCI